MLRGEARRGEGKRKPRVHTMHDWDQECHMLAMHSDLMQGPQPCLESDPIRCRALGLLGIRSDPMQGPSAFLESDPIRCRAFGLLGIRSDLMQNSLTSKNSVAFEKGEQNVLLLQLGLSKKRVTAHIGYAAKWPHMHYRRW